MPSRLRSLTERTMTVLCQPKGPFKKRALVMGHERLTELIGDIGFDGAVA